MKRIPSDPLMAVTWRDCLVWAASEDGFRARFEADTGMKLPKSSSSPLDKMIDEATGFDKAIAEAFIDWFNENVWGDEERGTLDDNE